MDIGIVKLLEMDLINIILVRNPFVFLLTICENGRFVRVYVRLLGLEILFKENTLERNIRKYYLDTFLHFVL